MNARQREFITEPEKRIPVTAEYDVVVVGGGIAGVAAAVAAARNGASTCIIEKEYGLGGLATLGNVIVYLPLCDGKGHQLVGGLGEELLRLSVRDGYDKVPACWDPGGNRQERLKHRFLVKFNPMSFMLELEEFIAENGVRLCYDTRLCAVDKHDGRIEGVIVENKDGRSAIACKAVVDATGDADVCRLAGEETVSWNSNVRSGWFYHFDGRQVVLNPLTKPYDPCGRLLAKSGRGFAGDRAEEVTDFVLHSRKLIKQRLQKLKAENPAVTPLFMPSIPTFRMTRRLKTTFELSETDDKRCFDDAVGMTGDWRRPGPAYYVPLKMLTAVKTVNLVAAGRCVSSGDSTWDVMRAIPACAVTGQGAGTAAALLAEDNHASFAEIDVARLRQRLKQQKVIFSPRKIGLR